MATIAIPQLKDGKDIEAGDFFFTDSGRYQVSWWEYTTANGEPKFLVGALPAVGDYVLVDQYPSTFEYTEPLATEDANKGWEDADDEDAIVADMDMEPLAYCIKYQVDNEQHDWTSARNHHIFDRVAAVSAQA